MPFNNMQSGQGTMNMQPFNQMPNQPMSNNMMGPVYPNWNRPPMMTPSQQHYLYGRIVSNPNEIQNNEIASDGSVTFFPTSDYNYIYAKAWDGNGNIQTVKYIPEGSAEKGDDMLKAIMDKLNKIDKALYARNKKNYTKNTEEVADE